MYNNELGRKLSNQINDMNRKAVRHSNMELEGEGMTGGFLGTLASALLPSVVGSLGKMLGLGMSGGAQCMCDDMEGGAILNKLREKMMMEGYGKGSAEYKKMDESKFGCGTSGGASGMAKGTHMDTGFDKTDGAVEGGGFLSDLNIPVVSNLFGMIGLGEKNGKRRGRKSKMGIGITGGMIKRQPLKMGDAELSKALIQTAQNIPTGKPEQKVVERAVMKGSDMSGFGKSEHNFLMKLKQKKLNGKKFTKAEMARLEKLKPRLEGTGFWSDFADGFMSVVKPVASVVKNITGLIPHPYAQTASGVLSALGAGKKPRGRPRKMTGGMGVDNQPHPAVSQIKRTGENADKVLDGGGFISKGKGKTGAGKSGGARKLTPYMELVMKVKKETGKSLKDSMKHIKQNGLYKK